MTARRAIAALVAAALAPAGAAQAQPAGAARGAPTQVQARASDAPTDSGYVGRENGHEKGGIALLQIRCKSSKTEREALRVARAVACKFPAEAGRIG